MTRYVLARLVGMVAVLWFIGTITFLLMHAVPGGPWDEEKQGLSPEVKANILRKYGLDRPLVEQYLTYWSNLLRGDLGIPFQSPTETVLGLIGRTWPTSVQLGLMSLVLAFAIGVPLGTVAALNQNSWIDRAATLFATFGYVIPSFVLASLMIWIISQTFKLLPPGGWDTPETMVMPVVAFALAPMAISARYTRAAILEVVQSDYVRTARAKGLMERTVIARHILRNALIPMVTIMTPLAGALVTGSLFIESIFRVPGIGKFFAASIAFRDYPMIMGLTLLYATVVAISYLITDILYVLIDPRVSLRG